MKLEKQISKEISNKLSCLELSGQILWYSRLNSGTVQNSRTGSWIKLCDPGTPDFICVLTNKTGHLTVLFIEAKREGVITARKGVQQEWRDKYSNLHTDMIYIIAQSVDDMMQVVLSVGVNAVEAIDFTP